jgi:hypothetical protein
VKHWLAGSRTDREAAATAAPSLVHVVVLTAGAVRNETQSIQMESIR